MDVVVADVVGGTQFFDFLINDGIWPSLSKMYVGPNGGSWSSAGNWSPVGVPTSSDQVVIGGGRSVNLTANAIVGALSLAGDATLNLNNKALAVNYGGVSPIGSWNGSAYTGITGLIASRRIVCSASLAVAVAEASEVLGPSGGSFNGQSVDATTILVKSTYAGDANLDGELDIDDYVKIDSGIAARLTGWSNGDFNYDGKINIDDYVIIDNNLSIQGPSLGNAPSLTSATAVATSPLAGYSSPKWVNDEGDERQRELLGDVSTAAT